MAETAPTRHRSVRDIVPFLVPLAWLISVLAQGFITNGVLELSIQIAVLGGVLAIVLVAAWRQRAQPSQFSLLELLRSVTCVAILIAVLAWVLKEHRKTLEWRDEQTQQIIAKYANANAAPPGQPVQMPESPVE